MSEPIYLSNVSDWSDVRDEVEEIAKENGFYIHNISAGFLSTKVNFRLDTDSYHSFSISEFPGNCCALVLHGIQGEPDQIKDIALKIADRICEYMEYAVLYISGSERGFLRWAEKNDFDILVNDLYNPHSGNRNFFACRKFNFEEQENA